MASLRRRRFAIVAAFALIGAARVAGAAGGPFRLHWVRGPNAQGCLDQASIAERVSARMGRTVFSETGTQSIEGFVTHDGGRYEVRIDLRDQAGRLVGSRDLFSEASSCGALDDAAVLAIALTIDPNAAIHPPTPSSSTRSPPTLPEAPGPTEAPAPASVPPSSTEQTNPVPGPRARPTDIASPHERTRIALRAALTGGLLPRVAPGVAFAADVPLYQAVHGTAGMLFLPEVRTSDGRFGFGLTTAWLGACLAPWRGARGGASLCGSLFLGAIHAVVYTLEPTRPGDQLWIGAALTPAAQLRLVGPLVAEIGTDIVLPFTRQVFTVGGEPNQVFQQSKVAGVGFLGLGLSIP